MGGKSAELASKGANGCRNWSDCTCPKQVDDTRHSDWPLALREAIT